jgi:signal transduction histidine kinase
MVAAAIAVVMLSSTAFAQQPGQFGNADEARTMLAKAVAAVKADKAKALDMFNKGEGGFLDRDLYPFCFNVSDGKHLATQAKQLVGQDIRILKDPTGKAFGLELYAAAQKPEGQITEVAYMFPKPVADTASGQNLRFTTPAQKVSFVTSVGDIGCAVGYFR